jgi:hypothetical protein
VYDAIIAEFGNEVGKMTGGSGRPSAISPSKRDTSVNGPPDNVPFPAENITIAGPRKAAAELGDPLPKAIQAENESLKLQIAKIQETLSLFARTSKVNQGSRLAEMQAALAEKERDIGGLQKQVKDLQVANRRMQSELVSRQNEVKELTQKLKEIREDVKFESMLKDFAIEATGGDSRFTHIVSHTSISAELPILLAKYLEDDLRRLLGKRDQATTLHDLIMEVRDAEALPPEAIDLGHLIRKQRNIVAHGEAYGTTIRARALLCLFAAALLWPEFPEA